MQSGQISALYQTPAFSSQAGFLITMNPVSYTHLDVYKRQILHGTQGGVWGLFGDMVVVNWQFSDQKAEYVAAAKRDAQLIAKQLPTLSENLGLPSSTIIRLSLIHI